MVGSGFAERRGRGEDAIYVDHEGNGCTDPARHRYCAGRWRGEISAGYDGTGRRIRRKVSGQTKAAVQNKLKDLHQQIDAGISRPAPSNYTLRRACEDWLAVGLSGRSPKTVRKNHDCLQPLLKVTGSRRLAEPDADEVHDALKPMAARYSTAVVRMAHNALTRAIRHARARKLVAVNVAELTGTPPGQPGRPSRAFTRSDSSLLPWCATGWRRSRGCGFQRSA